tara:strand:+ start:76 stop:453 length:378 start_codon:yes stop_codon:yes gene_type:complete
MEISTHEWNTSNFLDSIEPLVFEPGLSKDNRVTRFFLFKAVVDAIITLGWHEHTSDWDPILEFHTYEEGIVEVDASVTIVGYDKDILYDEGLDDQWRYVEGIKYEDTEVTMSFDLMGIEKVILSR